jgi:hypothetical protein
LDPLDHLRQAARGAGAPDQNAFTEGNQDSEEAAELDLFAKTFISFVAFCEDFWIETK